MTMTSISDIPNNPRDMPPIWDSPHMWAPNWSIYMYVCVATHGARVKGVCVSQANGGTHRRFVIKCFKVCRPYDRPQPPRHPFDVSFNLHVRVLRIWMEDCHEVRWGVRFNAIYLRRDAFVPSKTGSYVGHDGRSRKTTSAVHLSGGIASQA